MSDFDEIREMCKLDALSDDAFVNSLFGEDLDVKETHEHPVWNVGIAGTKIAFVDPAYDRFVLDEVLRANALDDNVYAIVQSSSNRLVIKFKPIHGCCTFVVRCVSCAGVYVIADDVDFAKRMNNGTDSCKCGTFLHKDKP
jgi:hypothetical protein